MLATAASVSGVPPNARSIFGTGPWDRARYGDTVQIHDMSEEVRRAATPMFQADRRPGEWNRFIITVVDDQVTVELNGQTVIREAHLPRMPKKGSIGLQHHGDPMEFANIYIKEL